MNFIATIFYLIFYDQFNLFLKAFSFFLSIFFYCLKFEPLSHCSFLLRLGVICVCVCIYVLNESSFMYNTFMCYFYWSIYCDKVNSNFLSFWTTIPFIRYGRLRLHLILMFSLLSCLLVFFMKFRLSSIFFVLSVSTSSFGSFIVRLVLSVLVK